VIGRYALLASRIRQDLAALKRVVDRVERAMQASRLVLQPGLYRKR
jgi:hypothetical protein